MNISESVEALLSSEERVVEQFYTRFLAQHPELAHHFESRDMERQASMVTMGLLSVEAYYTNRFPAVEHYLKVLGDRHYHNGIRPDDLPRFRDTLLETLEEFHGDDWNEQLRVDWRNAIDLAIEMMLEGYKDSYTF